MSCRRGSRPRGGSSAAACARPAAGCRGGEGRCRRAGARRHPGRSLRKRPSLVPSAGARTRSRGKGRVSQRRALLVSRRRRCWSAGGDVPGPAQVPSGSSTSSDGGAPGRPKRIVARRGAVVGGPPRVAGRGRTRSRPGASRRRSRRRSGPVPVSLSAPRSSRLSNTNGISSACVERRMPPNTGVSHVKRYDHTGACAAWASASRIAGMRNTPSVEIASHSSGRGRVGPTLAVARERPAHGVGRAPRAGAARSRRRRARRSTGRHREQRHLVLVACRSARARRPRCPRRSRRAGAACSTSPSTTGWNGSEATPSSRRSGRAAREDASVERKGLQRRQVAGRDAEVVERCGARSRVRAFGRAHPRRRAALRDRPAEQARARRACRAACRRWSRPPTRRRSSRCPGSPPNAAMQSRTHSSAAIWSRMPALPGARERAAEQVGEVQEAERTEAVVDRDDDDVAVHREVRAVVPRRVARAPDERAAVDPHHHRPARVVARRGPHVEVEAVLAVRRRVPPISFVSGNSVCADWAENASASRTPSHGSSRCGRLPAQRPDRRRRVRDAAEHVHAVAFDAFDLAAARRHDRHGGQATAGLQTARSRAPASPGTP